MSLPLTIPVPVMPIPTPAAVKLIDRPPVNGVNAIPATATPAFGDSIEIIKCGTR